MKGMISYVDDYCFDCKVMCKQSDEKHKEHEKLSDQRNTKPPDLGVKVRDGIGAEDIFGGG